MLSGKGRHRRPRQLPAVVVAAGVAGAGIAMPLLGATTADAADAPTWDRVAQCESGGLWSADTGNGFYGGLQLTPDMWKQYGGTEFAPRPDQASRAQQIAVAQRILDARGPYAWPACAVKSDLAKDGRAPEVNPGMPHDAVEGSSHTPASGTSGKTDSDRSRETSSDKAEGKTEGKAEGKTDKKADKKADEKASGKASDTSAGKDAGDKGGKAGEHGTTGTTGNSGTTDASGKPGQPKKPSGEDRDSSTDSPSGSTSGGKHRKPDGDATDTSADRQKAGRDGGADSGTSATGTTDEHPRAGADGAGTGKHRAEPSGSGGERASRGAERGRVDAPDVHDYTVRPGDNLSEIAEQHRVEGGWHRVYQDNKKVVGSDPDLIHPGQQLELKK
ncbi:MULTISPECIES: transglycosylase family protein [Streptomyces]|uniref:transglycosylase family protein n=1 Tax=Streptomyces TaxID=1883 RepID=UPI00163C05F5|nr:MULTISPECIES: transglycosylase family protein [Streptomyces]MBC2876124.1 transglycosylase family protein [Streptomyces sp. TYQ1024]UBI38482.1 transglycosylase family protein [Streptomyces mobaraensis]UKW31066.1 transglycosylase family protein [Streptomyces sp. TYQ1024]